MDDTVEAPAPKLVFLTDQEKAALNGISVDEIARTLQVALQGAAVGTVRLAGERNPLGIELRLPRPIRSSPHDLDAHPGEGTHGHLVPLAEIGRGRRPASIRRSTTRTWNGSSTSSPRPPAARPPSASST